MHASPSILPAYIHTPTYSHTPTYQPTNLPTTNIHHTHTYTHTYIHTHIHTYIHTHITQPKALFTYLRLHRLIYLPTCEFTYRFTCLLTYLLTNLIICVLSLPCLHYAHLRMDSRITQPKYTMPCFHCKLQQPLLLNTCDQYHSQMVAMCMSKHAQWA